jgi:hypothetical protein
LRRSLSPRHGVMVIAAGRMAIGAAVLVAPEQVASHWLGEENAGKPAVIDLARGLAIRDMALSLATLQTLNDPVGGPRIQAACAAADLVDAIATIIARKHLPRGGAVATVAVAGGGALAGFYLSHKLAHV